MSIVMVTLVWGVVIAAGAVSFSAGLVQQVGVASFGIVLLSLLSYFVQGPAEETLFRGWLMPALGDRYRRRWVGVLGSSIVFSLAHSLNRGITLIGYLNLFLFGLYAGLYMLYESGLWGAGAWHGAWNWMMGNVFGFTLDGSPHVGLFRSIDSHGPNIFTGGAFGPDGGLVCTAVLLTAIGVSSVLSASRRAPLDSCKVLVGD